jgi:hypothetical protein
MQLSGFVGGLLDAVRHEHVGHNEAPLLADGSGPTARSCHMQGASDSLVSHAINPRVHWSEPK